MAVMEIAGWVCALYGFYFVFRFERPSALRFFKKYRPLILALIGLSLWVGLSLLATPLEKPFLMQFGFMRWTILLVGLTFCFRALWSPIFERRFIKTWVAILFITGLYALLQFLTGVDLVRPGRGLVNPQGPGIFKAIGFFSMSLTYAYVFGISTFAITRVSGRLGRPWLPWALALVGALGLLASMSKGAWVSAFVALGTYLFLVHRRWVFPFLVATVVTMVAVSQINEAVGHKVQHLIGLSADSSTNTRVDLWRGYLQMFLDHPFAGVGLFEGDKLLDDYFSRLGIEQPFRSHAHNVFLQWLAGTGIPGFLFYLFISSYFLWMAWGLRRRDGWGYGLLLAQIFWHLGSLTEANFFDGEVNHAILLIWALTWFKADDFTVVNPANKP